MTADEVMTAVRSGTKDAKDAWAKVDALVQEFDPEEITRLVQSLLRTPSPSWPIDSVGRRVLHLLALEPGWPSLSLLLDLMQLGATTWSSSRLLESLVAQRKDGQEFVAALPHRGRDFDFFAGLLHCLVCRGVDFTREQAVHVFHDELEERAHPLAPLPLALTHVERSLLLATHHVDGSGSALHSAPKPVELALVRTVPLRNVELPDELELATRFWTERESAGVLLKERTSPLDLRSLPLESLRDDRVQQVKVDPGEVFARLFQAASQGGAYTRGEYDAFARLSAFRSLKAFCLGDGPLEVDPLLVEVDRCEWWLFFGGKFFADVAWDLGVACIRSDGITVVAHAATDTD